jgi:hypothetical protein
MADYQVLLIERPPAWQPTSPDDVPPDPGPPVETLRQTEELFAAVRCAVAYNEKTQRDQGKHWAVVVEPGSLGRTQLRARLCTPLSYKVTAIWWPTGWEPESPVDVPKCGDSCQLSVDSWQTQKPTTDNRQLTTDNCPKPLSYPQATAIVRGLNEQAMQHAGTMWYVVIAVENEPVSQTISHDASGTETTVEVRRLHVVRPETGGGPGDCSHCPAHSFDCAKGASAEPEPTLQTVETRKG